MRDIAREFALLRRKQFGHDRSKTIGASEIAKCARRVKYTKLGTDYDEGYVDANGFATRGDIMEDAWSAPLVSYWVEKHGGKLLYATQAEQQSFVGKKVPISATPDGIGVGVDRGILGPWGVPDIGKSKVIVPELKSISPRFGKHKLPKPEHPMQTLVQLGMIRQATKYKPDWGAVIYIEADDFWNINVYPVKWDEKAFKSLVRRASIIMNTDDPNKLPPEGKAKGGSECSECPFAKRCLGYRPYVADDDPRALPSKEVAKIEKLAKKAFDADQQLEAMKRKKAEAEADLYLGLGEVKRKFVAGKAFKVAASITPSQKRNNAAKLIDLAKSLGATEAQLEACKTETKEGTSLKVELV